MGSALKGAADHGSLGRYMNRDECAEYIRSTPGTVAVWTSKGRIPHIKISQARNGKVLYDRIVIDEWLAERTVSVIESN
jgi:hypothetical protein